MKLVWLLIACIVHSNMFTVSRFHVLTVASHMTKGLSNLLKSVSYNHLTVTVMGMGVAYQGNGLKLMYLRDFIEALPPFDIVMLIDAYDVLLLEGETEIVSRFMSFNMSCVIAAETNLQPSWVVRYRHRFPASPTRFKYLNAGGVIGYVHFLKKMLHEMQPIIPAASDQGQLIKYYIKHQHDMALDINCDLFLTLHDVKREELLIDSHTKSVRVLTTGTSPCVIHGNGSGKELYRRVARAFFR